MNILIADDESDIRDIITFTLEAEAQVNCTCVSSGDEAISKIRSKESFDIIISDFNMPDGNGGDIYQYLLSNDIQIPFVLCSSVKASEVGVFENDKLLLGQIEKPFIYDGIIQVLEKYEQFEKESLDRNESQYIQASIKLFDRIGISPCDVWLKLNDEKYLKILNAQESFTRTDFIKYQSKNISSLYIDKRDIKVFVASLVNKVDKILENNDLCDTEKVLDAIDIILDTVNNLGFSSGVIRATEQSVNFMLKTFEKNNSLNQISYSLFKYNESYKTKHSIAIAYISCGLISKTSWDTPENRAKLVMAGFLHDTCIDSKIDERNPSLSRDQLQFFEKHPLKASNEIKELDGLPGGIDLIIQDHHEKPDGSGFPRGLTADNIKPIPTIFIFSHHLADILLTMQENGENLTKVTVLNHINREHYKEGHFKKCIKALDELNLFK